MGILVMTFFSDRIRQSLMVAITKISIWLRTYGFFDQTPMGYGLQQMYGLSLRDEPGSARFLWVTRDYELMELWVRRASTVEHNLSWLIVSLDCSCYCNLSAFLCSVLK